MSVGIMKQTVRDLLCCDQATLECDFTNRNSVAHAYVKLVGTNITLVFGLL